MTRPEDALLAKLASPVSRSPLRYDDAANELVSDEAGFAYPLRSGIPILLAEKARSVDHEDQRGGSR